MYWAKVFKSVACLYLWHLLLIKRNFIWLWLYLWDFLCGSQWSKETFLMISRDFICGIFFWSKETLIDVDFICGICFATTLERPMIQWSEETRQVLPRGMWTRLGWVNTSVLPDTHVSSTDRPDWKGIPDYIGSTSDYYIIEILWPDIEIFSNAFAQLARLKGITD